MDKKLAELLLEYIDSRFRNLERRRIIANGSRRIVANHTNEIRQLKYKIRELIKSEQTNQVTITGVNRNEESKVDC